MKKLTLCATLIGSLFSYNAFAGADVIAVSNHAKSVSTVSLDLVSDVELQAFEFEIPLKSNEEVNLDNCTSQVPSNFSAHCALGSDGKSIIVLAYSADTKPLAKGVVPVGTITINTNRKIAIDHVLFTGSDDSVVKHDRFDATSIEDAAVGGEGIIK